MELRIQVFSNTGFKYGLTAIGSACNRHWKDVTIRVIVLHSKQFQKTMCTVFHTHPLFF